MKGENLWVSRLADIAGRITKKLVAMGVPNVRYISEPNMSPNTKLTMFFEGVLGALEQFRANRATSLANEARKLCRGALTKVTPRWHTGTPTSTLMSRWRACQRVWTSRRSRSVSSPSSVMLTEFGG